MVGNFQNMEDKNGKGNERVETYTKDEVFCFISENFSEVASKFKGKPKAFPKTFHAQKAILHACKIKT